ncbi:penicillin-binding protein 1A [Endozoicomonas sp. SCSIO W0465]|uniref:penicillin-binding protein 1A n=1 Tax=Endozoicomonas sp. SCSIO W0465 TaxID=2918516 RepID=UPI002075E4B5|nr:penicillin-binding protein 1A [Endozoicomonas sp. SCSIO W0465]USE35325.1 penicillin-binding protein 1A [Endozoicomonas sp. SCSIO W0465]
MKRSVKLVNFIKFLFWSLLTVASGTLLVSASAYLYLSPSLPSVESLRDAKLQTPLRVYSQDNLLIAEFGEKRRSPIQFEDAPTHLIKAFMAAEDDRFYYHPGVDIMGLIRAAVQLVSTGSIQSGGSTITMQVAKNFFLSQERVFSRKFNEILLALQIEQRLSKDEIFELYLNKIYLGNRSYGVEAAAQVYYGKAINELNLAEIAMIAGLPKAPSRYNPINDPKRALIRRDWILGRMKDLGYVTHEEYVDAVSQPVTARYHGAKIELEAPYIAEMVRQHMVEQYGPDAYTEGFKVYTTVSSDLQKAANLSVANGLMAYNERHGYQGPVTNLFDDIPEEGWQQRINKTPSPGILLPAMVTRVGEEDVEIGLKNGDSGKISWDNLNWAKPFLAVNSFGRTPKTPSDVLKIGDQIWVRVTKDGSYRLAQEPQAQAALVSMNPENGAILALVGGYNFYNSMYNRATQAIRQAGSSFKPFVYAAAIANGMTAATIVNDAPIVFDDANLEDSWRPNNDNMKFNGPMRLREGLYRSRNLVSIRVLRQVGISKTVNYLKQLGFKEESLSRDLSLSLGNVSMTPLELASGYAVLANGGFRIQPWFIQRIETIDELFFQANPATACNESCIASLNKNIVAIQGEEDNTVSSNPENEEMLIQKIPSQTESSDQPVIAKSVMSPQVNYIMNDIMNDVIWKGTGKRARALKRHDIGGKTGTTNDSKDAWFVGFNPDVLTAVWMGMDDFSTLGRWEYGANAALPIWLEFMHTALDGKPEYKPPQPKGMITLKISPETGMLAVPGDPNAIFEIFRQENAPQQLSDEGLPSLGEMDQFSPEDLF